VRTRAAAAMLCLLCALAAGASSASAASGSRALATSTSTLPGALAHGAAGRAGAAKRKLCARLKRRRARRAQHCRTTHHAVAKRPTPVTSVPLAPAALLLAPVAIPAPATVLAPAASAPTPSTLPGEVVAPTETEAEPPSVPHVQVSADEYYFTLSRQSVPAGKVVLQFVNDGQDEHNLQIAGEEEPPAGSFADTPAKGRGQLELEMHAGSYTLFCSLQGHEQKGMKATLTVE
jgi:plastocyanin